jgi:hypothetical protein
MECPQPQSLPRRGASAKAGEAHGGRRPAVCIQLESIRYPMAPHPSRWSPAATALTALGLFLGLNGCGGSSSTTSVAPSSIDRCGVSLSGGSSTVPAGGGNGTLTITVDRECAWTARSESPWISLASAQGQGRPTSLFPSSRIRTRSTGGATSPSSSRGSRLRRKRRPAASVSLHRRLMQLPPEALCRSESRHLAGVPGRRRARSRGSRSNPVPVRGPERSR